MKKTVSVKKRILQRFLIITVFVGVLLAFTMQLIFHLYLDDTYQQDADSYAVLIKDRVIGDTDIRTLQPDKPDENYNRIQRDLEKFCTAFDVKYIFVYTMTDDGMIMRNLIATGSKEDKKLIEDNNLLGKTFAPTERGEAIIIRGESKTSWEEKNQFGNVRSYMYAVYDDAGKLIGFVCMDVPESEIQSTMRIGTVLIIVAIAVVLYSLFAIVYWSLNKNVFKPLGSIADMMRNYIDDYGKPKTEIEFPPNTEIQTIVNSFDKMTDDIEQYIGNIELLTEERAKNEAVMDAARRIQAGFVPREFERHFASADVSAIEKPSKAVGGDFYGCFEKDGKLYGAVGDVSEKGISAALFMAALKSKISGSLHSGVSPAEALMTVNDDLCDENPEGMFATLFVFVLDLNSGEMTFANAGHNRPVVISDGARFLEMDSGMLIGLIKGVPIKDETLTLKAGDAIMIYTDGVTEAVSKDKAFYGDERLLSLVESADKSNALKLTETVKNSVDSFQADCEQFDDITVLTVKYYGKADLNLPCEISSIKDVREAVFERLGKTESARKILLAAEEIIINICTHSGADYIRVTMFDEDGYFALTVADNGKPFNPLTYNKEKEFHELAQGGMGIGLVKQIADKTEYSFENGENIFKTYYTLD